VAAHARVLEEAVPGGAIIATLREDLQSATVADIARLEAKLDALLTRA
jgi:hypothetical protein